MCSSPDRAGQRADRRGRDRAVRPGTLSGQARRQEQVSAMRDRPGRQAHRRSDPQPVRALRRLHAAQARHRPVQLAAEAGQLAGHHGAQSG